MKASYSNNGSAADNPKELSASLDRSLINLYRVLLSAKDFEGGQELVDAINSVNALAIEFPKNWCTPIKSKNS